MAYYVGKILQQLLWPLNWGLMLLLLLAWRGYRRSDRTAAFLGVAGFLVLGLPSLPLVSQALLRPLETRFPDRSITEYPAADAIVVLGGSVLPKLPPRTEPAETGGSRIKPAAKLFLAGKGPVVLTSSGVPYTTPSGERRFDADDMKELLVAEGVAPDAVVPERKSRNTRENARYSGEILRQRGVRRILLVSSAFHLNRAVGLFEKEGFEVVPVPTAIEATDQPVTLEHFFPQTGSLVQSTRAIKEYVGRLMGY